MMELSILALTVNFNTIKYAVHMPLTKSLAEKLFFLILRKFSLRSCSAALSMGLDLYLGILKTSKMIFLLYIILEVS